MKRANEAAAVAAPLPADEGRSSGARREARGKSTEQLLEGLVETFRTGCIILENPSSNREETLANTLDMAVQQMQQLADHTRITDSEGLRTYTTHASTECEREDARQTMSVRAEQ